MGSAAREGSLGIRNCNPGNIKSHDGLRWRGQIGEDSLGFCVFENATWGIRAIAYLLDVYQHSRGCDTVDKIIRRWSATDQDAYVKHASQTLGVSPTACVDLSNDDYLYKLIRAIIMQENGYDPYSEDVLRAAIALV